MKKEFTFNRVITFHVVWQIVIAIPCILLFGAIYSFLFKGNAILSMMMLFTLLTMGAMYLNYKIISVKIVLRFDEQYFYVKKGRKKTQKYEKTDIIGFYSFDYETRAPQLKTSKILFQFYLKNEKKLYLYDIEYRDRFEEEKGKELRKFLFNAQQELHFSQIRRRKWRNTYWYSK